MTQQSIESSYLIYKKVQAVLRASDSVFKLLFDHFPVGIGLIGLDRTILEANQAVCQMLGRTADELRQMRFSEAVFPEDVTLDQERFDELFEGKRSSYQAERRYRRADGSIFWGRATISMVRDEAGNPVFAVGMLEDIEEQRTMHETIRESEVRFRTLFDNTSVGIALMTLNRHILSANQRTEHIIGYPLAELLDLDPTTLAHPDEQEIGMDQYLDMIAGKISGFSMEKRYIRKDGRVIWARVTYSVVPGVDGSPEYVIGTIEDISEPHATREKLEEQARAYRTQLEQAVQERTAELKQANRRLQKEMEQRRRVQKALAARAAEEAVLAERTRLARELHDAVTQTLFSASLIAEVLPELWTLDEAAARQSTDELRQLTRGALAEMRTLLLELRPAALTQARLEDLLRQLIEALVGRARLPVELAVSGEARLPPEVQVAFYRIAQESLNNVVKYARPHRVAIQLGLGPGQASLEIGDDGVGFDPTALKPTSLGLRIMRERAEAIGAHLQISSTPGAGTTISVEWKAKEPIGE